MVMVLTPVVNINKVLPAIFAMIFICQKIANTNCNYRKAAKNTLYEKAAHKMLMKLTPGRCSSEGKREK